MSEPRKDIKVMFDAPMHSAIRAFCETMGCTMAQYIEAVICKDMGRRVMDTMMLGEQFQRAGISRDDAERAIRKGATPSQWGDNL
jgi:hypothetical protein